MNYQEILEYMKIKEGDLEIELQSFTDFEREPPGLKEILDPRFRVISCVEEKGEKLHVAGARYGTHRGICFFQGYIGLREGFSDRDKERIIKKIKKYLQQRV